MAAPLERFKQHGDPWKLADEMAACVSREIEVYAIGSIVKLDGALEARITALTIRGPLLQYEVTWWNERERQVEWVEPCEILGTIDVASLKLKAVL